MSANAIGVEASRLITHPKVSLVISRMRQAHYGEIMLTKDKHLRELERLREIALDTGNVGAAVQAEQLRGKVEGHYVEHIENVTSNNADIMKELAREMAQLSTSDAQELVAKLKTEGITLTSETKH